MKHEFQTLSQHLLITRRDSSPAEVLNTILLGVVRHLGPMVVGHAKAVARVEGGIVYASTTGIPPTVEVKTIDSPVAFTDRLQVDLLCVFHGIKRKTLAMAWQEVLSLLSRDGFQVTALAATPPSKEPQRILPRIRMGIAMSLLPSFLVLKPCCLIPVLGSVFGGSISVLHIFAPLEPYRPVFMLVSLGLLGSSFYSLYWRSPVTNFAESRQSVLASRVLLWIASGLFVGATLSPLLLPQAF